MKRTEIKRDRILVVEGNHDQQFFEELLDYMGLRTSDTQIITTGGIKKFGFMIKFLSNPNLQKITRIGFVKDADNNPAQSAFQSICSHLKKNQFPVPKSISDVTEGDPRCGIFIMPDNESCGMLESLCLRSIQGKAILKSIDQYMEAVKNNDAEMYRKLNLPKSKILTYLAGRDPYSNTVGLGAKKKHFAFNHECFDRVKCFLNRLYS